MRVKLCEHCLGKVEFSNVQLQYVHVNPNEAVQCQRTPQNPVPTLHVKPGAPDRQALADFERAELTYQYERVCSALVDVWRNPISHERWIEISNLIEELGLGEATSRR